jgi:exodeoxyribonuclease VII small subunit
MAKAPTASTPPASPPASFETALGELETIVKALEGGPNGLPLEESLAAYQRGMTLLRYCQEALLSAEQKIQILEKDTLRDFSPASDE